MSRVIQGEGAGVNGCSFILSENRPPLLRARCRACALPRLGGGTGLARRAGRRGEGHGAAACRRAGASITLDFYLARSEMICGRFNTRKHKRLNACILRYIQLLLYVYLSQSIDRADQEWVNTNNIGDSRDRASHAGRDSDGQAEGEP